jgi:hypothetical protein
VVRGTDLSCRAMQRGGHAAAARLNLLEFACLQLFTDTRYWYSVTDLMRSVTQHEFT